MQTQMNQTNQIELDQLPKEALVTVLLELIKNDGRLRSAIMDVAYSCPNIVTQI